MNEKTADRQTALITGASSGIGEAFARRLAADGIDLVITARRKDRLRALADELLTTEDIKVEIIPTDLAAEDGLKKLENRISGGPPIDMLINCAGFGTRGHLADLAPDKISKMIFLHTMAPSRLTRAVLPGMISRNHGSIVAVSSLGAFLTTAEYVTYSATKAYLNTFYTGLRDELAGTEVKVQAVCPGLVKTEFMETEEYSNFNYSDIPDFAWMSPETVVSISLQKLKKNKKPVVITGFTNRLFVGLMNTSIIGPVIRNTLGHFSRKRVIKGDPALF